jgi:hypothetical protein
MSREISRYTFHVNSGKRSGGTPTDITLSVKEMLTLKSRHGKFQIVVHACNIPFSYYQLSSDIRNLECVFTDTSGNPKTATIYLTAGNYTTVSVLAELSAQLISMAQASSGAYTGFTPVFNFTYSTVTSKSTFAMTGPVNASIQMKFATNTNLGIFFGLSTNVTISSALTVTSTKVSVANPVNYLLLRSGNLRQIQGHEYIVETDVFSDIVYRIPVGVQQNSWIQNHSDGIPIWISNNNISDINLYLSTNLTYTPIDLQGLDWACSFSIIEYHVEEYEPLGVSLSTNFVAVNQNPEGVTETPKEPQPDPEIEKLKKQYEDEIAKLELYKKKLEKRQLK